MMLDVWIVAFVRPPSWTLFIIAHSVGFSMGLFIMSHVEQTTLRVSESVLLCVQIQVYFFMLICCFSGIRANCPLGPSTDCLHPAVHAQVRALLSWAFSLGLSDWHACCPLLPSPSPILQSTRDICFACLVSLYDDITHRSGMCCCPWYFKRSIRFASFPLHFVVLRYVAFG